MLLYLASVVCVVSSLVQCSHLEPPLLGRPIPVTKQRSLDELEEKYEKSMAELRNKFVKSLAELSASNATIPQFEIVEWHSLTTIAGGLLWNANVTLNVDGETDKCMLVLWEKYWSGFKKFDVECGQVEPKRYYQLVVGDENSRRKRKLGAARAITKNAN